MEGGLTLFQATTCLSKQQCEVGGKFHLTILPYLQMHI